MITLLFAACNQSTQTQEQVAPSRTAITGVAIVDVERGIVVPDQTVIIAGDRIETMGPRTDVSVPNGSHVIDSRGRYLIPGLTDAHVHLFDPEVFVRVMIANGVLLVRDMGQPTQQALSLRDALNQGEVVGPEMLATGSILDGSPPVIPSISLGLSTPEEGRAAVRRQAEAGVDMIKVYSRLDKEVFLAIVDEAQRVGLRVVGHVPDSISIEDAAAAGLHSSEHPFGFEKVIARLLGESVTTTYLGMGSEMGYLGRLGEVNPEALQGVYRQLRDSGLTVCPTVVVYKTLAQVTTIRVGIFPHQEVISPGILDLWRSQWVQQEDVPDFIWRNWAQMVGGLNTAGVPLMVGTDLVVPGIIPGYSVHEEMVIWQEAGIPPADVLRSATLVPAQFMGLAERLGTVAEGKTASLVLLTANPLEDIRNAQVIEAVFLRGQYYSRADLDRLLDEAAELALR